MEILVHYLPRGASNPENSERWQVAISPDTDGISLGTRGAGVKAFLVGTPCSRTHSIPPHWERDTTAHGLPALNAWDGSFVAISGREDADEMWIATDRCGSIPLYAGQQRDLRWVVGTDPAAVAVRCGRPRFDVRALYQWICFGYVPTERTLFEGVRMLPCGSWFNANSGKIIEYWTFDSRQRARRHNEEDVLEQIGRLEDLAVNRCLQAAPGRPVLLLSSGYDSRSLLFRLLDRVGPNEMAACTFAPPDAPEAKIVRALAQGTGVTLERRGIWFLAADTAMQAWASLSGDLTDNVFSTLPGGPSMLQDLQGDVIWLGTDSCSSTLPLRRTARTSLIEALSRRVLPPTLLAGSGMFSRQHLDGINDSFAEAQRIAEPHPGESFHQAYDRLSHERRFRLWNVNRRLMSTVQPVVTPLHDVDLMEYYYTLPVRLRYGRAAHIASNQRRSALFRNVPVLSGGLVVSHLNAIRREADLRLRMIETVKQCEPVSKHAIMDVLDAVHRSVEDAHPMHLLLLVRMFMASTTWLGALRCQDSPLRASHQQGCCVGNGRAMYS